MPARKFGGAELIKAVITRLKADALTSSYSIYNYVPDTATLPYIRVAAPMGGRSDKFGSRDFETEENTLAIDIWSDYMGSKEVAQIMNNIVQVLTGVSTFAMTGYPSPPLVSLEYHELMVDDAEPGRVMRHGIQHYIAHMIPGSCYGTFIYGDGTLYNA